jgi:eukaryotic-like serine/threonine-protein kinase
MARTQMPLASGTKLGPYEIQSPLGAGGMGEVYRARDVRLDRVVAVKVLPPSFATDADRLHRFEREARSVAALSHPNILAVHDIGTHDGTPYMVTELLEGETLRERLQGGSVSARKAIEIAIQIAHGLAAAYDKGIIHRDLKPENIFLTKDGRVKILDFGLAKLGPPKTEVSSSVRTLTSADISLTEGGQVVGTAGYMSPEQVRGIAVDHRSDIFVFGAILFEMLSGQRAFRRDTAAETMTAILKEDLPEITELNRSISPALDRIVRHCLEKNPDQRFQSARDLAFDLESLSGASSTAQGKVAQPTTVQRVRRFQPAIAIALVVLAAAAGYFFGHKGKTSSDITYHQLTFRKGTVLSARFAPDNHTVIYSAAWAGQPPELFSTHLDSIESRPLGLNDASLLGISSQGELAVSLKPTEQQGLMSILGTLARTTLTGGSAPREVLENVEWSDWSPDGSTLLIVRSVDNENRIEYPAGKVIYKTPFPTWVSHPRISRDGKHIAFCQHGPRGNDRGSLTVMNADGSNLKSLGDFDGIYGLAWSPRNDEVWFTAVMSTTTLARVLMAVTLSGKSRLLASAPGEVTLHDVAPDGTAIISIENRERKIFFSSPETASSETKADRELTWLDRAVLGPLSLDGKQVVFWEGGKGGGPLSTIFLRKTDGSPAVRLGQGYGVAISPDQKWVLASTPEKPPRWSLVPTGAGETTELKPTGIELVQTGAGFAADSRRVIFNGTEAGHKVRAYVFDPTSGKSEALTPEGVLGFPSGDGKFLIEVADSALSNNVPPKLLTLGSNELAREIKELGDRHVIGSQITPDGSAVFVADHNGMTADVYRLEVATGKRELVKKIEIGDPAGAFGITGVRITPDGKSFAYNTLRQLSELYLLHGLK